MCWIRPGRSTAFSTRRIEYYFYVELVGDPAAEKTAALLRELNHVCRTVRLLGVYNK